MQPFFHSLLSINNSESKEVTPELDSLAYTWFGRPNYAASDVAQKYWIGSTKDTESGTTQHITEYDMVLDTFTSTQVGSLYNKDDHNQSQILIRESDKRLIVFYTEHVGSAVNYRISINPLDSSAFGVEKTIASTPDSSYASPYQASNGNIFVFWRYTPVTIQEEWWYSKSTDGGVTFGTPVKLYETGVRAYLITNQLNDAIHFIASDGHPQTNFGLLVNNYHFKFNLLTEVATDSVGSVITLPLVPANLTPIYTSSNNDTSWILDITTKNNLPRVLYLVYPDGMINDTITKQLWYAEFNGLIWTNKQLISTTMVGYIEKDDVIGEYAYSGASRFDTTNPDIIWMPKQVDDILEIHKVDLSINPIYIEQITFNSTVDNWRPISVNSSKYNLLWLRNNSYISFLDFNITLMAKTVN